MITAVDHLVILVDDLGAATADYAALGFTVTPGGEHTGGATHNALIGFADGSYFELLAFRAPSPSHHWWRHAAAGEGIIDFALLPDAIEQDVAAARARGLEVEGPTPGGRLRPDGQQVAWQSGRPAAPDLPFLCGDVTPRDLRVPGGSAARHPNGALGIAAVRVAAADPAGSAARYAALIGGGWHPLDGGAIVPLGQARIVIAGPSDPLAADRLARRGDGPYAVELRGGAPDVLDLARAHGAHIRMLGPTGYTSAAPPPGAGAV